MTEKEVPQISHSQNLIPDGEGAHPIHPLLAPSSDQHETSSLNLNLNIPFHNQRDPSIGRLSSQSMRTSSFAMSDITESNESKPSSLDSSRIRRAYVRSPGGGAVAAGPTARTKGTTLINENGIKDVPSVDDSIPDLPPNDYLDEKDFMNTDRYGFLVLQTSNCDPPEERNRAAVNGTKSHRNCPDSPRRHKLLRTPSKRDILIQPRNQDDQKLTAKELERAKKWRDMAYIERPNGSIKYRFPVNKKLLQRTFKGIPDCWRATVWHDLLWTQASQTQGFEKEESEEILIKDYHELLQMDSEDDAQIDLDVPRTISEHIFFRQRYGAGQRLLFQVLHCISLKFPDHGYVQGMAPIAATLLCYYPGEIAFAMLVRLWQGKGLKNFFSREFDGLMTAFSSLEESLKYRPVGKKLSNLMIDPPSYATRWYLTLFNYSLPFHTQLRIWDALMISSDGPALLHATALALLNGLSDRLKDTDFEKAMKLITTRIDVKDDDKLMRLVFKEAIANGALRKYDL